MSFWQKLLSFYKRSTLAQPECETAYLVQYEMLDFVETNAKNKDLKLMKPTFKRIFGLLMPNSILVFINEKTGDIDFIGEASGDMKVVEEIQIDRDFVEKVMAFIKARADLLLEKDRLEQLFQTHKSP